MLWGLTSLLSAFRGPRWATDSAAQRRQRLAVGVSPRDRAKNAKALEGRHLVSHRAMCRPSRARQLLSVRFPRAHARGYSLSPLRGSCLTQNYRSPGTNVNAVGVMFAGQRFSSGVARTTRCPGRAATRGKHSAAICRRATTCRSPMRLRRPGSKLSGLPLAGT